MVEVVEDGGGALIEQEADARDEIATATTTPEGIVRRIAVLADWGGAAPFLAIATVVAAGYALPAALGLSLNPLDYYAFVTSGGGHQLLPGIVYADPNVGWTNQALGHQAAVQWISGKIPWWNPYSGIGMPLAGEMQPAAFFLPFILLLALPGGILWLMSLLQFMTGSFSYILFRRLDFGKIPALGGGLLVMLGSTFAFVPGETILNAVPFLPLLLIGIEMVRHPGQERHGLVLVAVSVGWSLLSGFPEVAFIDGMLASLWAVARWPERPQSFRYAGILAAGVVIGLMLASPVLVAFADFVKSSNVFQFHGFGHSALNVRGFAAIVMPYVFGPMGSAPVDDFPLSLANVTQGYAGYLGATILPLMAAGLASRRLPRLKWVLAGWLCLAAAKTFGWHPAMAAMNAIPFMSDVIFFRYSPPSWDMAAVVLALMGLEEISSGRVRAVVPTLAALVGVGVCVALAWPTASVWHWPQADMPRMVGWFAGSVLYAGASVAAIALASRLAPRLRGAGLCAILVADAFALFMVPRFSASRAGHVDRPAIAYLRQHVGLGRFYSLGPIAPNYGAFFGIPSLDSDYVPVARNWVNYIAERLYPPASVYGSAMFWPGFQHSWRQSAERVLVDRLAAFRGVGVNYIVTPPQASFTPGLQTVPESDSRYALPIWPGKAITVEGEAPSAMTKPADISEVAVDQGTYSGTADGEISLRLCVLGVCGTGITSLDHAFDNRLLWVHLDRAVRLVPGALFTVTVAHRGGSRPEAIWLFPRPPGAPQTTGPGLPSGALMTARVVFGLGPSPGLVRVYTDAVMDIWRLNGARSFWLAAGGGCRLQAQTQTSVVANCARPATLSRASLFMAGWHAEVNGRVARISPSGGIMQQIALPEGASSVRFWFRPPGEVWAGWGASAALLCLLLAALGGAVGPRPVADDAGTRRVGTRTADG